MRHVRPLLLVGNGKLGQAIHHFDLAAIVTCPGRSTLCEGVCYAHRRGRFAFPQVQQRLAWNLAQSRRDDFAGRMVCEIRRKGVLVVRIHVSGDFYDFAYTEKWLEILRACPATRFYFYTRSWRVPEVAPVLEAMARLRCCRAWYSVDAETGLPPRVPRGVRLAYLQAEEDTPARADLVFRVHRLRRRPRRVGLPMVCPAETPEGHRHDVNCGNCQHCWR